ncbi:MAG: hypothetical protein K2W95_23710 [Candidatus Obscuribacterales bacterium]|nr:hypothetical protein [Candidatus Obscuribacterales bacterium]
MVERIEKGIIEPTTTQFLDSEPFLLEDWAQLRPCAPGLAASLPKSLGFPELDIISSPERVSADAPSKKDLVCIIVESVIMTQFGIDWRNTISKAGLDKEPFKEFGDMLIELGTQVEHGQIDHKKLQPLIKAALSKDFKRPDDRIKLWSKLDQFSKDISDAYGLDVELSCYPKNKVPLTTVVEYEPFPKIFVPPIPSITLQAGPFGTETQLYIPDSGPISASPYKGHSKVITTGEAITSFREVILLRRMPRH